MSRTHSRCVDMTARASLAAYNTSAEVDLFLDAVRSYAQEACVA